MKRFIIAIGLLFGLVSFTQSKERIIIRPPFLASNSSMVEIAKVALTDTATIVYFKAYYRPKYCIKISTKCFLKDNNGEVYPFHSSRGIEMNRELQVPESGEAEFQIIFPPLSIASTSVDFWEGESGNAFKIWGIQLKSKKLPELTLPEEAIIHKPGNQTALPSVPDFKYSRATLRGRLLEYRQGMVKEITLRLFEPVKGFSEGMKVKIKADGSFSTEIQVTGVTPASFDISGKTMQLFLTPGQISEIIINTREVCRQQSRLHHKDKPYGEAVYMSGPLAGIAQELNRNTIRTDILNDFRSQLKEVEEMDADTYKAYMLAPTKDELANIWRTNKDVFLQVMEANKKESRVTIHEVGEVKHEELFTSLISKFHGKVILIDVWATWCGPCRIANKKIAPMKVELEEKEIVYLYVTGESSPLDTWKNMITELHGEHFRITAEQWKYLTSTFKIEGIPTYFIVDREGRITYRQAGFPGTEKIKEELMQAVEAEASL